MISTKINKLIWVVFLLPYIYARAEELKFTDEEQTYLVLENRPVTLVCVIMEEGIFLSEVRGDDIPTYIVVQSKLKVDYTDRFSYEVNGHTHKLTIKKVTRDYTGLSYECGKNTEQKLTLDVAYTPRRPPTCAVIPYDGFTTTMQCISEIGYPESSMLMMGSRAYNDQQTQVRNSTHIVQTIPVNIDDITTYVICAVIQTYTQGGVYHRIYDEICTFMNINVPPPPMPPQLKPQRPFPTSGGMKITNYSIFMLILVILSRAI